MKKFMATLTISTGLFVGPDMTASILAQPFVDEGCPGVVLPTVINLGDAFNPTMLDRELVARNKLCYPYLPSTIITYMPN